MSRVAHWSVVLGLLVAAASAAQERWAEECHAQLAIAGKVLQEQGYSLSHQVFLGELADGGEELLGVTLDKDKAYALVGVCDEACQDLDLALLTADGGEVDSDVELDDYPMVEVEVTASTDYRVRVMMADCRTEPCSYGVGVFVR